MGLRYTDHVSAFPPGLTTGATWNRDLIHDRGVALGLEARRKGVNVLLGPSMGSLGMMPAGGRNWESFGSDPVLQGVAAAETIRGIQSNGVMATAKHYVMNEQEHFRQPFEWGIPTALSSNVDDRALHEVFIWPFAESIRADVASVMCAYQMSTTATPAKTASCSTVFSKMNWVSRVSCSRTGWPSGPVSTVRSADWT